MILPKIVPGDEIRALCNSLRLQEKKIVFTNGCFDLLHAGHVLYLESAKNLGEVLIVGLNSDASVQRLKGPDRPVNPQEERGIVLAALEAVDYVVVFDADTPYDLIAAVQPNVLVKGGDWAVSEIVGADLVLGYGGEVRSLSFQEGLSTSKMISRIRKGE